MEDTDEIRLGPIRLELQETTTQGEYVIVVHTKSTGTHGMGTPTTMEEWRRAKRIAGLEGLMGETTYQPDDRGATGHAIPQSELRNGFGGVS